MTPSRLERCRWLQYLVVNDVRLISSFRVPCSMLLKSVIQGVVVRPTYKPSCCQGRIVGCTILRNIVMPRQDSLLYANITFISLIALASHLRSLAILLVLQDLLVLCCILLQITRALSHKSP
jgi:hypothetical protein